MEKKVFEHGNTKVTISDDNVEIDFGFKKSIYKTGSREYLNYSLLLGEENNDEFNLYLEGLIGIELLSSYAHSDPELTAKMLNVVIEDFTDKLNNSVAPDNEVQEATDLLNLRIANELSEMTK